MPPSIEEIVSQIHESPVMVVIAIAGGGATAIARLLEAPGASRTVLEAVVPYSPGALAEWLGSPPDQACSARTARWMAMAAFRRACHFVDTDAPVAGVACTASLATDIPKRGEHRAHLAAQSETLTTCWSLGLAKGRRTRAEEERLVGSLALSLVARACGVEQELLPDLVADETIDRSEVVAPKPWQDLLMGRQEAVRAGSPHEQGESPPRAIFPGAFNPLHGGHRRMAQLAQDLLGVPVDFELSILNVDKPPLDYWEIGRRTGQFAAGQTVWLTRLSTFEAKSRRFPGATFVVGADTLRRIADSRYYGNDPAACRAALEAIAGRGCRFLVFARPEGDKTIRLADLDPPEPLRSLCREVPPERFLEDVSSTDLRAAGEW